MSCLLPPDNTPTVVFCDNDATSILIEDHIWHARVKHIHVKYHYVRKLVANKELTVQRVRLSENTVDILTKPLNRTDFIRLQHYLGLTTTPVTTSAQ